MRHFDILNPTLDSTRQMFSELENDLRSSKIDLGIGIYRDERGEAPVFKALIVFLSKLSVSITI